MNAIENLCTNTAAIVSTILKEAREIGSMQKIYHDNDYVRWSNVNILYVHVLDPVCLVNI
jgi:hypothetical protein